jgi:hypothetical protein
VVGIPIPPLLVALEVAALGLLVFVSTAFLALAVTPRSDRRARSSILGGAVGAVAFFGTLYILPGILAPLSWTNSHPDNWRTSIFSFGLAIAGVAAVAAVIGAQYVFRRRRRVSPAAPNRRYGV